MSQKAVDQKNRWRSKTVAFRVSPEEWDEIERLVKLSGMSKQGYIMHRLQNRGMMIQASPRVVKYLKNELTRIIEWTSNNNIDTDIVDDIRSLICMVK